MNRRRRILGGLLVAAFVCAAAGAWAYRWWEVQQARERGRTGVPAYSNEELEAMSRNLYKVERAAIVERVKVWDWAAAGPVHTSATGLVHVIRAAGADTVKAQPGDAVAWTGEVRLPDSTVCFTFSEATPLLFRVDRADLPSGFHELARMLADGDSAEALVPSYLGWGLSGHAPEVPNDAVLWICIRQRWAGP